jgi:hypothetical protein
MAAKKKMEPVRHDQDHDANPDPITGAPGSHPVGAGVGGTHAAGGLAGKAVEETIDPTAEDAYWRNNYSTRPYVDQGADYGRYQPAYRYGWESRGLHAGRKFDDVESDLSRGWQETKESAALGWEKAKHAARDAWERVDRRQNSSPRSSVESDNIG